MATPKKRKHMSLLDSWSPDTAKSTPEQAKSHKKAQQQYKSDASIRDFYQQIERARAARAMQQKDCKCVVRFVWKHAWARSIASVTCYVIPFSILVSNVTNGPPP